MTYLAIAIWLFVVIVLVLLVRAGRVEIADARRAVIRARNEAERTERIRRAVIRDRDETIRELRQILDRAITPTEPPLP